jgi:hypothetical protein
MAADTRNARTKSGLDHPTRNRSGNGFKLGFLEAQSVPFEKLQVAEGAVMADMKKNLNDDTRRIRRCEEPVVEKKAGWVFIVFLFVLILILGYFLFT